MILIDSNVFLIDRFFKRDDRFHENKRFVEKLGRIEAYLSIFSLLELCGIASFNLSPAELKLWSFDFSTVYLGLMTKSQLRKLSYKPVILRQAKELLSGES